MKRVCTIFVAMLLSLVITLTSGGLAVVHCAHSGTSHMALLLSLSDDGCARPCMPGAACMSTEVVKLLPTCLSQQPAVFDFHVLQPVQVYVPQWLTEPVFVRQLQKTMPVVAVIKGPPRCYLNRLCILII